MRHVTADVLISALVVLGMVVFLLTLVPDHYTQSLGGDHPYYQEIARAPLQSTAPAPWRYRILNPALASALMAAGLSSSAAFLTLTAVFAAASCVLMRIYLQQLGVSLFAARAGALLFAVSVGAFVPLRRYYGYTDAMTNFFILLVLVLAAAHRHIAAAVALGIGTLAKESTLLVVPFVAWRAAVSGRSWRAPALLAVVPVAVFLLLRIVVGPDPSGGLPLALSLQTQFDYWQTAMVHGPVRWVLWSFAYSMGPVWLLAAMGFRHNASFVLSMALYALPILVPLARTTDTERALMLLFPIAFPLAAYVMDRARDDHRAIWKAGVVILCTWLAQLTFDWTPQWRVGPVNAKDLGFITLCLVPVLVYLPGLPGRQTTALSWPSVRTGK